MKPRLTSITLGLLLAASTAFATPRPVITVDGVAAAARLQPATRDAIAPKIVALNAQLEKVRDAKPTDTDLRAVHEACLALRDAIASQLDEGQRTAFVAYLHAQMDAAGIDYKKFHGQHHEHHE
jgi:hypothetical protein